MLQGMIWVLRTGVPWRDLPPAFGKWQAVYAWFRKWSTSGLWALMLKHLQRRSAEKRIVMIDSTSVRAHQHAAGAAGGGSQGIGRSCGGATSKIHLLADAYGRPLEAILTGGNVHDATQALPLLDRCHRRKTKGVVADKGYDSDAIIDGVMQQIGAVAVIPSKTNRIAPRPLCKSVYRMRQAIENTFAHLKHFRRFATRYDKLATSFMAFVNLAFIVKWLPH